MILKTVCLRATSFFYRLSLRTLPKSLRIDYADEFDLYYDDLIRDVRREGVTRICAATFHMIGDVLFAAARERWRAIFGPLPFGRIECTPKARRALCLAAVEAEVVGDSCCSSGHVLLGLLREGRGLAAKVLAEIGMTVAPLRAIVALVAEASPESNREVLPIDLQSELLTSAREQAASLGHDFLGTEHVLLALLCRSDERLKDVFRKAGVTADEIRAAILSTVAGTPPLTAATPTRPSVKFLRCATKVAVIVCVLFALGVAIRLYGQSNEGEPFRSEPVPSPVKSESDVRKKYQSNEIDIPLKDGQRFKCTLIMPESTGRSPAVLMIPGYVAGYHNRAEEAFRGGAEDTGTTLSRYLAGLGIAVLRIPIGGGTAGREPSMSADDLADRAIQCIEYLRTRSDINPKQVGIIGQSVGGYIATMAAARSSDVAFVVTLATPVESIDSTFLEVLDRVLSGGGAPQTERNSVKKQMEDIFAAAAKGAKPEDIRPQVEQFLRAEYKWLTKEQRNLAGKDEDEFVKRILDDHVQDTTSPMFRSLIGHDVTETLAKIHSPQLILFGERDYKVEPTRSAEIAKTALKKANANDCTVEIIGGADHFFEARVGGVGTSNGGAERRFAPGFLDLLSKWLLEHVGSEQSATPSTN
jgi:dienelactone hydrolase